MSNIQAVYLLVNPLYGLTGNKRENCAYFMNKWKNSMQQITSNYNSYGILVLDRGGSPRKEVDRVISSFKQYFPFSSRSIGRNNDGNISTCLKLNLLHNISDLQLVSARGFWTEQCVKKGLESFLTNHSIPRSLAQIEFHESSSETLSSLITRPIQTKYIRVKDRYVLEKPKELSQEDKKLYTKIILNL